MLTEAILEDTNLPIFFLEEAGDIGSPPRLPSSVNLNWTPKLTYAEAPEEKLPDSIGS